MKTHSAKYFVLILLFGIHFSSIAQITLVRADLPTANDTLRITSTSASDIDLDQTGPDFNWDFSGISSNSSSIQEYKSSLQTPYALFFLGLTIFGLKGQDIGIGGFGLEDLYNFYLIDNNQYAIRGLGFKFQGIPFAATYSRNDKIFSLPLRYNDSDSNNFSVTIDITGIGKYKSVGYRKYEVDGWGKITTPYGTFDCLRVKSFVNGVDSINVSISGFNFNIGLPNSRFEYAWYAKGQKEPVMFVEARGIGGFYTPTRAYYRGFNKNISTSTSANTKLDGWKIFPNPAKDFIEMQLPESFSGAGLQIFDVKGSLVFSNQVSSTTRIQVSDWAPGVYSATVNNGQQVYRQSLMIAR